jgi:hypothetical protein
VVTVIDVIDMVEVDLYKVKVVVMAEEGLIKECGNVVAAAGQSFNLDPFVS